MDLPTRNLSKPLLVAGVALGVLGDSLLRPPPGLNMFLMVAAIALAALALQRRSGLPLDRERAGWLGLAVLFAAGFAWRDSTTLKPLALGCVTLALALSAYRADAGWVRRTGVVRYAEAWAMGALHAWTASALVVMEAMRSTSRPNLDASPGWRRAAGVGRGVVIATPLVIVFSALFMSADAVFNDLVLKIVRLDMESIGEHVVVFGIFAWLCTGYLRGYVAGTELTTVRGLWGEGTQLGFLPPKRPTLGITEVATMLAALNLLFLLFVSVQGPYLFGGDALVQVTPGLTYAEYARRGFFELVVATALVVPILLASDWLLARRQQGDDLVFRILAGAQTALVLAIAASALQRLQLYYASYGLTESRFYAMVLLLWIGAMLLWLAATVLRGRREVFAFGALASGLATLALLFILSPDAIVARTNVARIASGAVGPVPTLAQRSSAPPDVFDVAYATTLSADAVPVLIEALPALPADVQCPLALHLLRRWPPDEARSLRNWNWSAVRASRAVREREGQLRAMLGPDQRCAARGAA